MGNEVSSTQGKEEQHSDHSEVAQECSYNAVVTDGSSKLQALQTATVENQDSAASKNFMKEDSVVPTSQNTTEINSVADADKKNNGKDASKATPAAKSLFSLSFSRNVPSRTENQKADLSLGSSAAESNSSHPSEPKVSAKEVKLPESSAQKLQGNTQTTPILVETPITKIPEAEETSPKTKATSFFDTLFKGSKDKEKSKEQTSQQELPASESLSPVQEIKHLEYRPHRAQKVRLDDDNVDSVTPAVSASVPLSSATDISFKEDSKESGNTKQPESSKAESSAEQSSIMSFFKTFGKGKEAQSKETEAEPKSSAEETGQCDPPSKDQVQADGSKDLETSAKEKEEKESSQNPFSIFFKKDRSESAPAASTDIKSSDVESPADSLSPTKDESKSPSPAQKEKGKEQEAQENKSAKMSFISFFQQLSVKGEEVQSPTAAETNEKDPGSEKLDFTDGKSTKEGEVAEKKDVPSPMEGSPSIQKNKGKIKIAKKATLEKKQQNDKQEVKPNQDTPSSLQVQGTGPEPTTNGEEDASKKADKKPSFSILFKSRTTKEQADSTMNGKSEKETSPAQTVETARQDVKPVVVVTQQETVAQVEPKNESSAVSEQESPLSQKSKEPEQSPLAKLFKIKDRSESAPAASTDIKSSDVESPADSLSPTKDESKSPPPAQKEKEKEQETQEKPGVMSIISFFQQLSVREVQSPTTADANEKEPESAKLDFTDGKTHKEVEDPEKKGVPFELEGSPSNQKGKGKTKDAKKSAVEKSQQNDKQEAKPNQDTPSSLQERGPEPTINDEEDTSKKADKKPSFSSFFKKNWPEKKASDV